LDIDIVITCTDATVAQLLALYVRPQLETRSDDGAGKNHHARALQKIGAFTNGCGDPAIVLPTARPILPAT
jgi:hypothetical protein